LSIQHFTFSAYLEALFPSFFSVVLRDESFPFGSPGRLDGLILRKYQNGGAGWRRQLGNNVFGIEFLMREKGRVRAWRHLSDMGSGTRYMRNGMRRQMPIDETRRI